MSVSYFVLPEAMCLPHDSIPAFEFQFHQSLDSIRALRLLIMWIRSKQVTHPVEFHSFALHVLANVL